MMTKVSLRLALFTDHGVAGMRLQRGPCLPISSFDFPDTTEGRKDAELAREQLQNYCDRYHVPKGKEK
jgi:hypothetical protein